MYTVLGTEGVQKVYRRMYRRMYRRLKEKKAACALTGWLYGPQGMPRRDRAQAARSSWRLEAWSSDIHIVVSVQRPDSSERPWVYLCTFC